MMRKVKNLKPGDVITQDGISFVVHTVALFGENQVSIAFKDMPGTIENVNAFRKLFNSLMRDADCGAVAMGQPGWHMTKIREVAGRGFMEGRQWMRIATAKWGAILCPYMVPGQVYLHEIHTTTFVLFTNKECAESFEAWAKENIPYWGYDPVALLDTSDPEVREQWACHMKTPKTHQETVSDGMIQEAESGAMFLPPSHETKTADGPTQWWVRSANPAHGKTSEVVAVVEGGRVTSMYSTEKGVSASVIDADTLDTDQMAEIEQEKEELQRRILNGELFEVY